jgi:multisubunit Na+/H+ antiporter MnhB subunit
MDLIQLVVVLIVIGVLLWLVNTYLPMEARMKQIVNAVVVIAVVLWLLFWLLAIAGLSPRSLRLSPP